MLEISIPGAQTLRLDYLVADFNGTLGPRKNKTSRKHFP